MMKRRIYSGFTVGLLVALVVLAALTGRQQTRVLLSPVDFRVRELPRQLDHLPAWTNDLYAMIREELRKYPKQA